MKRVRFNSVKAKVREHTHGLPFQLAASNLIHKSLGNGLIRHISNIMDSNIKLVTLFYKGVAATTNLKKKI